jgi:hypothetical protein
MPFGESPYAVGNWSPKAKLPKNAAKRAGFVIDGTISDFSREAFPPVLRNIVRVHITDEPFAKFLFQVLHTLLVPFAA